MSGSTHAPGSVGSGWEPPKGTAMLGVEEREARQPVWGLLCHWFLSTAGGVFNNMDQGWLKKKLNVSPPSQ